MTSVATPPTPIRKKRRLPKTYDELRDIVDNEDGIIWIRMGQLRDLNRSGKLGVHVVNQISRQLKQRNLAILLPSGQTEVPRYQDDRVVIYATDAKVGEIIDAVRTADLSACKFLRSVAGDDSLDKLEQVREVIEDLQAVLDD